jgi:hypothetical protein
MNYLKFKNVFCNLFASLVVIFAIFSSIAYSQNQAITEFPESSFQINWIGSTRGYEALGNNRHQLTYARSYQTTAMWYIADTSSPTPHSMLDLSKDFVFDCYFAFDDKIFFKKLNFIVIF